MREGRVEGGEGWRKGGLEECVLVDEQCAFTYVYSTVCIHRHMYPHMCTHIRTYEHTQYVWQHTKQNSLHSDVEGRLS